MSTSDTPNTLCAQDANDKNEEGQIQTSQVGVETNEGGEGNENADGYGRKKRQKTSDAWSNFVLVTTKDGPKAECVHCKKKMAINSTGATTHLNRHVKTCPRKPSREKGQQNLSITTTLNETESVRAVQNFKYDQAKMREVIPHMLIVHELPFTFVEYDLFNLVMKTATPHYQSFSRVTAKKDCMTTYHSEKKKVMNALKDVNRVSVTTNLWKSDQKISYMVVTCHYVDSNYNLQKRTLNFCDIPPPHTGVAVCDVLYKCLVEWGLENKCWTITVDNAAYNDVAVRMLKENLSYKNTLPLNGKLFHVRCCAHILNILVQDGLSEIEMVIHSVRESVKHVSASEMRINIFSEIAKQLQLSSKKLVLYCCTRWNATYFMLSSALEFKDVFPRYQQRDPTYIYLPSEDDWEKVRVVCSFLEEFNEVTCLISGTEYPTSNLFLTELYNIKKLLNEASADGGYYMEDMIKRMKDKFEKYWGDCNLLISMAAVLDPRYKMKFIEWCFPSIYSPATAVEHITMIREMLRLLYTEYVEAHNANVEKNVQSDMQIDNFSGVSMIIGKVKGKVRDQFSSYIKNVDSVEKVKSELEVYLEEGVVIWEENSEFDALSWWRTNNLKFRILSRMASDVLAIPITTVASESAFSAGGRVIDPYRANLGVETVQALLCGEDWLRAHYNIKRKGKETSTVQEIQLS